MASIIPGRQIVEVISALPGGNAERVLRAITHPSYVPKHRRDFGVWEDNASSGIIAFQRQHKQSKERYEVRQFPVTAKAAVVEGLFLYDDPGAQLSFSLKPLPLNKLSLLVPVPEDAVVVAVLSIGRRLSDKRVRIAADAVVATWVIHGEYWKNRHGKVCQLPYAS